VQKISHKELVEKLSKAQGAVIVGLLALTDARALKTGNPFGKIFKQFRSVGFCGANYQTAVEREANRQGSNAKEFESEKLPWGSWLIPHKIISHKNELYLRTQTTPGNRRKQPVRMLAYRDDTGKFLSREEVKPFLPKATESAKQQDEAGLSETIWVRTYKLNSIQKIRIFGKTFELIK
jgi:hypothetical protein